jgi:large repetitive protein
MKSFSRISIIGLVCVASALGLWGAQPLATMEAASVAPRGGDAPEFAVVPQGPGWLHLPDLMVSLDPAPPDGATVWVQGPPPGDWIPMALSDGSARLPLKVASVSDLWALRFRIDGAPGALLKFSPVQPIVLTDLEVGDGVASALTLTNWGDATSLRVKAVDLAGRAVALQTADVSLPCSLEGEWYELGTLSSGVERDILVAAGQEVRYPVTVTVEDDAGTATYAVMTGAPEAAPVGQVNYYGFTPTQQWNCGTGALIANATSMVITAIVAPVTYTVYNLTDGTTFATGTISAKGSQATVASMTDGKSWKLATSLPVQAYMGYDCSGTLPGSLFYLADDGLLNYGTSFTVPFANWEATAPYRLQYWVFATGAGTVTVKTLAGTTMLTNTFAAAGAWQIPLATLSRNTVYLITFVPTVPGSGATIAVQQSSQNAATDVPAITQVANACTVTNVGRTFYVDIQQYTGDARIVAFAYEGSGAGTITATNLATSAVTTITTTATTGNAYESAVMATGAYRINSTVNIGVIAGSPEGGTAIYDLGDDAFYYHGDGTSVRGAAMRCGGKVFVAQDGTTITAACTPGTPCGLPTLSNPYAVDSVLTITGDSANTNIFNFTTQDTQHTLLVEVIGGNCATQLNDWSKVLQPAALGRPVITYPLAGSPLLSTTPTVVGTGFPGATVSLYVAPPPPGTPGTQVLFGTTTVDSSGNWSIAYPGSFAPLTPGTTYSFDAVQSISGACSIIPGAPPVGSSGSSGVINVTPPAVSTPADGSYTSNTTPAITGTAPAGTTVTVYIDGVAVGTTTADSSGNWTYTPSSALALGSHSVKAKATDGAGNVSSFSNVNTFNVVAPGLYITKTSSANGGYVSPGQTLTYTITVTNTSGSTWTNVAVDDPLPANTTYVAGSSQVTATYLDQFSTQAYSGSNGTRLWTAVPWVEFNDDGVITSASVRVDNNYNPTPPWSLRVNSQQSGGRTGLLGAVRPADLSSGTAANLTFSYRRRENGTANQHWYVDISKDGGTTWPTRLWTLTSGATDGAWTAPASPLTIPSDYLNSNFRLRIVADGTATANTRCYFTNVQISLTASNPPPALLGSGYTLANGQSLTITYQATINSSVSSSVANITNAATLTATGLSGGPYTGTVIDPLLAAPTVVAPANGSTVATTTPTVSGTVGASVPVGSTVTVYVDGTPHTTTVLLGGTWTITWPDTLSQGSHAVNATVTIGSAVSPVSNTNNFTIDTVAPAAPVVTAPANGSSTTNTKPPISGTAEAGSTVKVYVDGILIGTTTADGSGNWSYTPSTDLTYGAHAVNATATDAAGNVSPSSNTNNFNVVYPPPVVSSPINSGATSIGGTSTAAVGTTITVYKGGVSMGTTTVQAGGVWTLTGVSGLVGGESITATAGTGPAESAVSNTVVVTPAAPVVSAPINAGASSISGTSTAPVGSTITVYKNGVSIGTTTVQAGGTWTLSGVSGLAGGESITATVTAGGQTSAASTAVLVTPAAPTITAPLLEGATSVSGTSSAPNGSTVTVYVNGTPYTGTVSGGTYTVTVPALTAGSSVYATVTAGGQTSPNSSTAVVKYNPPVVSSPILAGASSLSGTSPSPDGTQITVYKDGVSIGTATVTSGAWTLTGVSGLVGGESITAKAGAGTSSESSVSNTVVVTPAAPVINSPIVAGATSVSGTSTAPVGSTVTVYVNGTPYTTTVQAGGTYTVTVPALAGGDQVYATVTAGGQTSSPSATATVQFAPPVVSSPILAGASSISGTSTSPVGTTITVYNNGSPIGTTTVQAGGTWTLTGVSGLVGGEPITATAGTGAAESTVSNTVVVTPAAPTITTPLVEGATSVSGTSTAPVGSTITVYVNGTPYTTTVQAGGTYTVTVPALAGGDQVYATVTAGGQTSGPSATATVQFAPPVVSSPILAGASSISGTSAAAVGTTITVYNNGSPIGTTTVQAGGTWTLTGVSGLVGGESITATAGTGSAESTVSNTVVVTPAAPVINSPIVAGATSVSGTSTAPVGSTVTVYVNGTPYTTTVQAGGTYTVTVPALAGGDQVYATVTAGGQTSGPSATTTVQFAPPVVTWPINAGASSISGTSTSPVGTTITVYNNGSPIGTTTVQAGGTWTLTGVSGLVGGESITATAGTGAAESTISNTVVVTPAAPVVSSPILAGATSVSGTSTAPNGSTVTVYVNGTPYTGTVSGGTFTVAVPALVAGDVVKATVTAGGQTSGDSNLVTVLTQSIPPIVTASLLAGVQTVSGSSVEAAGSVITVYVNGVALGTQPVVQADGSWSLPGVTLAAGDVVKATVLAPGKGVSGYGNQVTVASGSGAVTPAPVITPGLSNGATSVTGTSVPNAAVDVYSDGLYIGTVTADGSGNWTLGPGVGPLAGGAILTATATVSGSGTSDWSAPVIVGTTLMLLRSDIMATLTQARAPIFTHTVATPPYPSLETLGPNHVFNQTEGPSPQPGANGTLDDDKAYVRDIHSGDAEPEPAVLTDNGRPLVFYELLDNGTKTLKLSKSSGQIVFTITP